jgi:hypothetical protein
MGETCNANRGEDILQHFCKKSKRKRIMANRRSELKDNTRRQNKDTGHDGVDLYTGYDVHPKKVLLN